MLDERSRATEYWRANLRIIAVCLSVWALCSYGFAIILRPLLMNVRVGNVDLGLWFGQQGYVLFFIAVIFIYSWRMNKLDKAFGLGEESSP